MPNIAHRVGSRDSTCNSRLWVRCQYRWWTDCISDYIIFSLAYSVPLWIWSYHKHPWSFIWFAFGLSFCTFLWIRWQPICCHWYLRQKLDRNDYRLQLEDWVKWRHNWTARPFHNYIQWCLSDNAVCRPRFTTEIWLNRFLCRHFVQLFWRYSLCRLINSVYLWTQHLLVYNSILLAHCWIIRRFRW